MSEPVGGLENTDVLETWNVDSPETAAHFGLPWNEAGYKLLLLQNRETGGHATLVADNVTMVAGVRMGWPTEWPDHNGSDCDGHGQN